MFCHKCGNQSLEGAVFCKKCGTKLPTEDSAQQSFIAQKPREQALPKKSGFSVKKFLALIVLAIFIILFFSIASIREEPKFLCQEKVLNTVTFEAIYAGIDCEECYPRFILENGEDYSIPLFEDKAERFFGEVGNKVSVTYEVKQYWDEELYECNEYEEIKSGRIIEVGTGLATIQHQQKQEKTRFEEERFKAQKAAPNIPKVTAQILSSDYSTNELAADNKYRGKGGIIIHGTVESVQRTFGVIQVIFEGKREYLSNNPFGLEEAGDALFRAMGLGDFSNIPSFVTDYVHIGLDKSQENMAAKLRKGHQATVRCKDVNYRLGIVTANNCIFTDW